MGIQLEMSASKSAVNTAQTREDFLDEDPEISSQKYVLLSFISPENVLQSKDKFFFQKFMTDYEIQYKTKSLEEFLGNSILGINRKIDEAIDGLVIAGVPAEKIDELRSTRVPVEPFLEQYQAYLRKYKKEVTRVSIEEAYKDFIFRRGQEIEDEFHAANDFKTTVRGLKVRGVYPSTKEAEMRAKKLIRSDSVHNILVGEVGKWLPWDPSPNAIQEQEYAEDQLNNLMKSYKKNEENVEQFYRDRGTKRPDKRVHGATDEESVPAAPTEHDSLFDGVDLALERKMAALSAANDSAAAAAENSIVTPKE